MTGSPEGQGGIQNLLLRLTLRDQFTAEEMAELSEIVEERELPPGTIVLHEGTNNDKLFFLLDGRVGILRAGEKIATLSTPGDVLGEMSLITKKPCSASTVTETQTRLLVLELPRISQLSHRLQDALTHALNRLFSVILVEKLNSTNEKARLFEITNRELDRARKALEAASRDKIDDLAFNQRQILSKLEGLVSNEVRTISEGISTLDSTALEPAKIGELRRRFSRLSEELGLLARGLHEEGSLRDVRVLLAESDIDEQINARMSLGGTGVDLTSISDMDSGIAALQAGKFDLICVNSQLVGLIPFAKSLYPNARFVFMTSEPISQHLKTLRDHPSLESIIARHPDDRAFTVKNTATTVRKLSTGDIFGLEKYLAWGTEVREKTVERSSQRAGFIEEMSSYFTPMGIRGVLIRRCERVAEELLMNVIYDAPHDESGKPLYNHLDRQVDLALKPEHQGKFRYACDGNYLAVATEDPFGALTRSTILNYLERCFNQGIGTAPEAGKGGGGNGLFQIIQSSSLVVFNVRPRLKTEVIALFNINIQINKISVHPSFHYFEV